MPTYLIEVPHDSDEVACSRAIRAFLATGSHFLTNADWGCEDGEHKAWFVLEAESKDEARLVVPPAFRAEAKVIRLRKWTRDDLDPTHQQHPD